MAKKKAARRLLQETSGDPQADADQQSSPQSSAESPNSKQADYPPLQPLDQKYTDKRKPYPPPYQVEVVGKTPKTKKKQKTQKKEQKEQQELEMQKQQVKSKKPKRNKKKQQELSELEKQMLQMQKMQQMQQMQHMQNMLQLQQEQQEQQPEVILTRLSASPQLVSCPYCKQNVTSEVRKKVGIKTCLACIGLFFIGCWFCCCIPCCVDSCKDSVHYCSKCNRLIGKAS